MQPPSDRQLCAHPAPPWAARPARRQQPSPCLGSRHAPCTCIWLGRVPLLPECLVMGTDAKSTLGLPRIDPSAQHHLFGVKVPCGQFNCGSCQAPEKLLGHVSPAACRAPAPQQRLRPEAEPPHPGAPARTPGRMLSSEEYNSCTLPAPHWPLSACVQPWCHLAGWGAPAARTPEKLHRCG